MTTIIGSFSDERREALALAAARADSTPTFYSSVQAARFGLGQDEPPKCVFVDGCVADLESFVGWMRGEARLFSVPVVVIVPRASDGAYLEAHSLGADDVLVDGDFGGITRRIANLQSFDPGCRPPMVAGPALIAHQDDQRRRLLGRILRQAGFDVSFAMDGDELASTVARFESTPLLVASTDLPPAGPVAVLREVGHDVPMVALGPRRVLAPLRAEADGFRCVVGSDHAPPDHLLFLANELLRPDVQNIRASRRVLYGAICAFRGAGEMEPVYGLTYNLSREGLFVRTLDPPPRGAELWFEMRPPGHRKAVHLRGTCVWARGLNTPGGAAPPGFGLRVSEEHCPPGDLAGYRSAYEGLLDSPFLED